VARVVIRMGPSPSSSDGLSGRLDDEKALAGAFPSAVRSPCPGCTEKPAGREGHLGGTGLASGESRPTHLFLQSMILSLKPRWAPRTVLRHWPTRGYDSKPRRSLLFWKTGTPRAPHADDDQGSGPL